MKPVAFDYRRPRSLEAALELLDGAPGAKILAGGQTLGPMLNLRLVRPALLVDVTRVTDLVRYDDEGETLLIGASVTHAAIEDGRVPDPANGLLAKVARGIAYRAVRTRGTIGGSLAHADPAADWLATLIALRAEAVIVGAGGRRGVPVSDFVLGVFETALGPQDILEAIRIPKLGPDVKCSFYKYCRKAGEFAEAMAAAVIDVEGSRFRLVAGATDGPPIVVDDPAMVLDDGDMGSVEGFDPERAMAALRAGGFKGDAYELQIHAVAMERALTDALVL